MTQKPALRPDQLLAKQRRDAAAKQTLIDSRKPLKFKPIVLLGDKKQKSPLVSQASCYCSKCLRKYKLKPGQKTTICIDCGTELVKVSSRAEMCRIVRKLKKERRVLQAKTAKKRTYDDYLKSKLWRRIRKRVLARDSHLCRDCGRIAKHVHHLSYAALVMAGKDDSKLVSLCIPCHDARHPDKPSMVKK